MSPASSTARNTWTPGWVAVGAAAALLPDLYLRRKAPRGRTALQAAGLVTAAAIYPALHAGPAEPAERSRELAGVAAATAVAVLALTSKRGRKLLAAGWASHALFDAFHHRSSSSLLPGWYPAVCAGYDVALAAAIATSCSPASHRPGACRAKLGRINRACHCYF